jgi:hypothetical protein
MCLRSLPASQGRAEACGQTDASQCCARGSAAHHHRASEVWPGVRSPDEAVVQVGRRRRDCWLDAARSTRADLPAADVLLRAAHDVRGRFRWIRRGWVRAWWLSVTGPCPELPGHIFRLPGQPLEHSLSWRQRTLNALVYVHGLVDAGGILCLEAITFNPAKLVMLHIVRNVLDLYFHR